VQELEEQTKQLRKKKTKTKVNLLKLWKTLKMML
jgi:hypothetical protein